jgi:hypothetical protein
MKRDGLIALAIGLGALALYLVTLCPDLYWFDSAEFVNDAVLYDIPHPPGYPLYNLLAHLFTKLPFGTVAARVNALSAVLSCLAVAAFYLASRAAGVPALLAAASAALLAVSQQMWELAIVAEVYGLEALLVAVGLALLFASDDEKPLAGPRAHALALTFGLALFHRPTAVVFLVVWIAFLWRRIERPISFFAAMALGALPYLTTAWIFAMRESVAPGMPWSLNYFDFPRTFETFVRVCTGTLYAGNLGRLSRHELASEVLAYFSLAREQFGALVSGLAVLALVRALAGSGARAARWPAVLWLGNVVFFLFYNALEKDTMYVPGFLALLVLAQLSLAPLFSRPLAVGLASLVVSGLALFTFATNRPAIDRSGYHEVRRAVDATANLLPPRAVFYLTDDLIIHPFLYVMVLEGKRRDVSVQIVDGFGPEVAKGLGDRLEKGASVFSTLFYPEDVFRQVQAKHTLVPRGFLYEIVKDRAPALPRMSGPSGKSGGIAVSGVGIFPPKRPFRRSDQVQVVVSWDLAGADDPAAVFALALPGLARPLTWVHRIGYQGRPRRGGELTEEYLLKLPWDLPREVAGTGPLTVTVVPSIKAAVASGSLAIGNTRDWKEREFFKGWSGGFVRAIERGWPVFHEVLSLQAAAPGGEVALGQLELVR